MLFGWLTQLKHSMRSTHRPRRCSPLSPYGARDWLLEDRIVPTAPPYAMPSTNNAPNGATSVFWDGGTYPGQGTSLPAPSAAATKQVTIQNNTQQFIYPVLRDANSLPIYDPADTALYGSQEFREYIGFQAGGTSYLGLPPGASITITIPLVFWNAENTYFVTDGENLVPASVTAPNPYNYTTTSTRFSTSAAPWVASFSTPGGNPYNATGGAVLFYRQTSQVGFSEGSLAQLTEWTIRDPYLGKYFGVSGGDGSQNIFDYDVSYVNDALMPIAAEALSSTIPPPPATALGSADYGYAGATINYVNNPSDPLNSPSMQALISDFVNNSNLPQGGLGTYFNNPSAPTTNPGWPAFYNPTPADGTIIPSGANLFAESPLNGPASGNYGPKSPYDQNQWALTSSGTGPVAAPGATVSAGNSNPYTLSFPSSSIRDTFVALVQSWITNKTPLTVTDNGTQLVVATGVVSITAIGGPTGTQATVVLNTTPTTGNASWAFARVPSDYASQQIASIWYAWANYYLTTALAGFNGAKYNGTFQGVQNNGSPAGNALVLDKNQTDLKLGMLVTGGGLPAGTTIAYINPNNPKIIYLSKNPTSTTDTQYTFSKPTGLLPFTNDPQLYKINLSGFTNPSQAADFAAVVYETMVFENQSTFAPATNALQLVGKVIGADLAPGHFPGSDPFTVEGVLRDRIKSILRGVPDFTLPQYSSESTWYPAPSVTTAGGGQSFNVYNIDPFVWFVHDVLHFSGYGFSIDDDTGNVQAFTNQTVWTIGGPSGLPNKTQWSNQVQFGQQIAMAQILPPSKFVDPQFQAYDLLVLQDPISFLQISADSDLGLGAAVVGPGIPIDPNNPVRVIGKSVLSSTGQSVLVLNTKDATPNMKYVRLIFTSKSGNASSVVNQNFAAVDNSPNLGPNWANVGSGGLKISNHQAVGISSPSSFTTDEAQYVGPNSSLTNMAVAAVVSVSNSATYSYAGVFARRDSNNDFYAVLLVHDPNLNASSNFVELARFTPRLAGTVGGWTFLQVAPLNVTSAELQLQVVGVGLHTSLQVYVKDPTTNKTILALSWTEADPIYLFPSPYAGGVQTNPLNGPGTAGLLTFFGGGAFTNFTVFALNPTSPTLLGGSNSDPNANFVGNLYQTLLGRPADAGAEYWVDQLEAGLAPSAVIQGIEAGTEYLDDQVNNLYERYLQRPADTGGLSYFVGLLQNGGTFEQVISGLVSSSEYYSLQGSSNSAFVASLYANILGRTGSSTEVQGWVNAMAGGTTATQVANDFLSSQEYRTDLVESDYQTYLGRPADAGGLTTWVNALNQGVSDQAVLASILGSPEGFAGSSQSPAPAVTDPNTAYVDFLYQSLLGRAADAGADYWANLLDAGVSPSAVVQGIESGTEYLDIVVNNLYEQDLGRAADPAGLSYWVTLLQNGGTFEQVVSSLVSSSEYYSVQGGSNSTYVASLYANILGRTGSPTEVTGWVNAMAGGTTATQVANDFLSSQEYQTNLVESYYLSYLGRPADPAGLASWVNQLNQGIQDQVVLAAILGSSEAFGLYS